MKVCALSEWLGAAFVVTEASASSRVARGLSSCTGITCTSYKECLKKILFFMSSHVDVVKTRFSGSQLKAQK